jgi:hypothetical protein
VSITLGEPERIRMTINGTGRAALIILASCAASAAHAQTSRPQNGDDLRARAAHSD